MSCFSSSCGSLSTADVGPMIVGDPICVDDWVPELPPKKSHLRAIVPRHIPSPDLPPPSPPPVVDDEVFISDEPLPPPPPEVIRPAVPPPAKSVKEFAKPSPPPPSGDHIVVPAPRPAPPDLIVSSTASLACPSPSDERLVERNATARPKKTHSQCNSPSVEQAKAVPKRSSPKSSASKSKNGDFLRYSQHLYKDEVAMATQCFNPQAETEAPVSGGLQQHPKEPFARPYGARYESQRSQKPEFLAKRSVFAEGGCNERQSLRYSSTQKLQINGKLAALSGGGSNSSNASVSFSSSKYEHTTVTSSYCGFENKSAKSERKTSQQHQSLQHFSSGVLRHSEKFPPKLDPHCPPTTYQL